MVCPFFYVILPKPDEYTERKPAVLLLADGTNFEEKQRIRELPSAKYVLIPE